MFQSLTAVPVVEPLEQQWLELECVIRRRVGNAHQLGKDEEHEQVILLTPGPGNRTSIRRDIELFEQRLQPCETTLFLRQPVRFLAHDRGSRRGAARTHERRSGLKQHHDRQDNT